jgi:hypothetical protein
VPLRRSRTALARASSVPSDCSSRLVAIGRHPIGVQAGPTDR